MEFLSINPHNKLLSHFVNNEKFGKQYEDEHELKNVAGSEFDFYGWDDSPSGWLSGGNNSPIKSVNLLDTMTSFEFLKNRTAP